MGDPNESKGPQKDVEILVIDDDQDRLEETLEILGGFGYKGTSVACAKTEKDAMGLVENENPHLAVVDANLTRRLEEEGLRVIRAISQQHKDCVVICITSQATKGLGPRALRTGARDYIDCNWPYVNWVEFLKQRIDLWLGYLDTK